jgi:hypothetical protein
MKKLKQILTENPSPFCDSDLELSLKESASFREEEEASEEEEDADETAVAMSNLSDIMAMADDIYNTISGLDEVEESILTEIQSVTEHLAKVYSDLGDAHGIVGSTYGLESEITMEELESEESNTPISKYELNSQLKDISSRIKFLRSAYYGSALPKDVAIELKKLQDLRDSVISMLKEGEELESEENVSTKGPKQKIRDKIEVLKKEYQGILDMKKTTDYFDEYDPQARVYHDRRLKQIPTELNKLRSKLLSEEETESPFSETTLKLLADIGMEEAIPGPKTYYRPDEKILALYGIKMRAGAWADVFVGVLEGSPRPFFIADDEGVKAFSLEKSFVSALKKLSMTESFEAFGLEEKLSSKNPIEDWIHDFIKSDAPQFEGKDKKERIKMAVAAFYAATGQSKPTVSESNVGFRKDVPLDVYVYDFLERGNIAGPLVKIIRLAVGAYYGDQGVDSEYFKTTRGL